MLKKMAFGAVGLAMATSAVFAASHIDPGIAGAIKARKAHMDLNAYNIGVVGAMAQDKTPYDAEQASAAAANLAALAKIMNQSNYWPEGSDTESVGEETRALPALWEEEGEIDEHAQELIDATTALEAAAGNGLDELKAAMGPVGKACGSCHEEYRQKN